jgi:hypothetical protein
MRKLIQLSSPEVWRQALAGKTRLKAQRISSAGGGVIVINDNPWQPIHQEHQHLAENIDGQVGNIASTQSRNEIDGLAVAGAVDRRTGSGAAHVVGASEARRRVALGAAGGNALMKCGFAGACASQYQPQWLKIMKRRALPEICNRRCDDAGAQQARRGGGSITSYGGHILV